MKGKKFLLFSVNTTLMSIPVEEILSVQAVPKTIIPMLHSPQYVIGACNFDSKLVTLIDVRKWLGLTCNSNTYVPKEGPLIILIGGIGLLPEKVIGVEALSEYNQSTRTLFPQDLIQNLFLSNQRNEVVFELDISQLSKSCQFDY